MRKGDDIGDKYIDVVQIRTEAERRLRLRPLDLRETLDLTASKFGLKPKGD